ncbi:MAG: bifunctional 23S rRNA (guanine(2069)-N(7))-methyltransferase RlmK/23S rRNA (guanine(2445)-N(2))-methyltransferase RlmL [Desulfocapsaceae bacterium]|nr:bifunctional 23S rRNA (guanine(2069)-N(7))-methyltransferase RlmK/23S rRNA (guanine(2445)-N(2))-methyltransferase RlmL [Desulfocapsaceae bacterium]
MLFDENRGIFNASCAAGLEQLVAGEVESYGGRTITLAKGLVAWQGDLASGYRACLWSRFASRIFLQIAEFSASSNDCIYKHSGNIDWSEHLDCATTFAVDCTLSEKSVITHSKFASLRVKDAIVDQFRASLDRRPSVQTDRPGVRINLHVHGDKAALAIDLSGESMHRRGYRAATGTAPLKETLAAAIVSLAGWDGSDTERILVDPMCGSGTLLIEAALIFGDAAPGLSRGYFGFTGWKGHDEDLWSSLVNEAVAREEAGMERKWPLILGYDADPVVIAAARKNIVRAGLEERIRVHQAELAMLQRPGKNGIVICNPPYGERLADADGVAQLYRALGRILRQRFIGWQAGIFIANTDLADRLGIVWESSHKLYNGPLACRLFVGSVSSPETDAEPFQWTVNPAPAGSEGADFANRLQKNLRKLLKWAEREGVSCFRVYDRDMPEYNVSVDLYGQWVHVHEFAPPATVDTALASSRLSLVLSVIRETLGIKRERIFIKTRSRQKGKQQYEKKDSRRKMHEVREGGCSFLVNFTDYLDAGLFLDHRPIRARIRQEAAGKRFLNLFGYTGTASVCAAAGGAATTTTVDLSNTYLQWARANLSLNGFSGPMHETVQADCLTWLQETDRVYDLIFLDPPTFSNTKKAARVFDIQRDHGRMIGLAMQCLDDKGLLIFSTNFRKFILDAGLSEMFDIQEISEKTLPFDFERNKKIHRCWEIRKAGKGKARKAGEM